METLSRVLTLEENEDRGVHYGCFRADDTMADNGHCQPYTFQDWALGNYRKKGGDDLLFSWTWSRIEHMVHTDLR